MADKNKSAVGRIAFTLPVSCQICLGKVKVPVVCPNFHVFCSPCMDIWLSRNQQCPTCRIEITAENPCKRVLGGLSQCDEETDSFSNKDLRQARVSLLFKDYEDEIERLQAESSCLKQENEVLRDQVKSLPQSGGEGTSDKCDDLAREKKAAQDASMLLSLTKKIQETQALNEEHNKTTKKLQKENGTLQDENVNLGRENERLRLELANRSPIKYGRYTVAALENKVEGMEKEVKKYKIALERSDSYIEDIEKELEELRQKVKDPGICRQCRHIMDTYDTKNKDENLNDAKNSGCAGISKSVTSPEKAGPSENVLHFAKESGTVKKRSSSSSSTKKECGSSQKNEELVPKASPAASFYGKRSVSREIKFDEEKDDAFKHPLGSKQLTLAEKKSLKLEHFQRPSSATKAGQRTPKSERKPNNCSFELELPSPTTPSASLSRLSIKTGETPNGGQLEDSLFGDSSVFSLDESASGPSASVGSCRKKLKFDGDGSSGGMAVPSTSGISKCSDDKQVTFGTGVHDKEVERRPKAYSPAILSRSNSDDSLGDHRPVNDSLFEQPSAAFSDEELDPNISMTSDIVECMRLLDEAEKKVGQRSNEETVGQRSNENKMQAPVIKPPLKVPTSIQGLPGGSMNSLCNSQALPYHNSGSKGMQAVSDTDRLSRGSGYQEPVKPHALSYPTPVGAQRMLECMSSLTGYSDNIPHGSNSMSVPFDHPKRPSSVSELFPSTRMEATSRPMSAPPQPSEVPRPAFSMDTHRSKGSGLTTNGLSSLQGDNGVFTPGSLGWTQNSLYGSKPYDSGLGGSLSLGLNSLLNNVGGMGEAPACSSGVNPQFLVDKYQAGNNPGGKLNTHMDRNFMERRSSTSGTAVGTARPDVSSQYSRSLSEPSSLTGAGSGNAGNWVNTGIWNLAAVGNHGDTGQQLNHLANSYLQQRAMGESHGNHWK